jgi:hypothetical protein
MIHSPVQQTDILGIAARSDSSSRGAACASHNNDAGGEPALFML